MTKSIKWNNYLATAYTEGFCEGENAAPKQQLEAWAYLIDSGYISKTGKILKEIEE